MVRDAGHGTDCVLDAGDGKGWAGVVKLTELEPRFIHPNLFVFKCPHCQKVWLTCKNVAMTRRETWDVLKLGLGDDWNELVVPPRPETAWSWKGEFGNMTVTPSIDASPSGHWHGHITDGEIR